MTLGGAVLIGSVQGSITVHTGVNASQQLLHVKVINLDVAHLLKVVSSLIEIDTPRPPQGVEVFFVRKLEVYLSTGVELFDTYHPRGMLLDVDMTLFGKRATLRAEVQTGHAKLKGTVERFAIGDLVVSAASDPNKDPYVDIELSQGCQRIKVDGKVVFTHENWVIILIDIDSATGSFEAHLEIVVGDELKITVTANLVGGLPPAKQDRIKHDKDDSRSKKPKSGTKSLLEQAGKSAIQRQTGALFTGGLLKGKTLSVHAEVQQDIISHLAKLTNEHLGGERNPQEEAALSAAYTKADNDCREAANKYAAVKATHAVEIEKVAKPFDIQLQKIKESITQNRLWTAEQLGDCEQRERDLVLHASQKERDLFQQEQQEIALAEAAAREKVIELEQWRKRLTALQATEEAVRTAEQTLEDAERELADVQVMVTRHSQTQPQQGKDDVGYEPWS